MERFRKLLATPAGKLVSGCISVIVIASVGYSIFVSLRSQTPATAFSRMFICTRTGKAFPHEPEIGEMVPIHSPYSGEDTGVPAEPCYWTADGSTKTTPTWVLLNELAGKPGPTFCPDCGRLVVGHNPQPGPDVNPTF